MKLSEEIAIFLKAKYDRDDFGPLEVINVYYRRLMEWAKRVAQLEVEVEKYQEAWAKFKRWGMEKSHQDDR
jgi:hypothetical protein